MKDTSKLDALFGARSGTERPADTGDYAENSSEEKETVFDKFLKKAGAVVCKIAKKLERVPDSPKKAERFDSSNRPSGVKSEGRSDALTDAEKANVVRAIDSYMKKGGATAQESSEARARIEEVKAESGSADAEDDEIAEYIKGRESLMLSGRPSYFTKLASAAGVPSSLRRNDPATYKEKMVGYMRTLLLEEVSGPKYEDARRNLMNLNADGIIYHYDKMRNFGIENCPEAFDGMDDGEIASMTLADIKEKARDYKESTESDNSAKPKNESGSDFKFVNTFEDEQGSGSEPVEPEVKSGSGSKPTKPENDPDSDFEFVDTFEDEQDRTDIEIEEDAKFDKELEALMLSGRPSYFARLANEARIPSRLRRQDPATYKAKIADYVRSLLAEGSSDDQVSKYEKGSDDYILSSYEAARLQKVESNPYVFEDFSKEQIQRMTESDIESQISRWNDMDVESENEPDSDFEPAVFEVGLGSGSKPTESEKEPDSDFGPAVFEVGLDSIFGSAKPGVKSEGESSTTEAENLEGPTMGDLVRMSIWGPNPSDSVRSFLGWTPRIRPRVETVSSSAGDVEPPAIERTIVTVNNAEESKARMAELKRLRGDKEKLENDKVAARHEIASFLNQTAGDLSDGLQKLAENMATIENKIKQYGQDIADIEKSLKLDEKKQSIISSPEVRAHLKIEGDSIVSPSEYEKIEKSLRDAIVSDLKSDESLIFMVDKGLKEGDLDNMSLDELHTLLDTDRKKKLEELDELGVEHSEVERVAKILGFSDTSYDNLTAPQVFRIHRVLREREMAKRNNGENVSTNASDRIINAVSNDNEPSATAEGSNENVRAGVNVGEA